MCIIVSYGYFRPTDHHGPIWCFRGMSRWSKSTCLLGLKSTSSSYLKYIWHVPNGNFIGSSLKYCLKHLKYTLPRVHNPQERATPLYELAQQNFKLTSPIWCHSRVCAWAPPRAHALVLRSLQQVVHTPHKRVIWPWILTLVWRVYSVLQTAYARGFNLVRAHALQVVPSRTRSNDIRWVTSTWNSAVPAHIAELHTLGVMYSWRYLLPSYLKQIV